MAPTLGLLRPWHRSFIVSTLLITAAFHFVLQYRSHTMDDAAPKYSAQDDNDGLAVAPVQLHLPLVVAALTTPAKRKAIIAPVQKEDETVADWLAELLPDWEPMVFVTDRTSDEEARPNASPIRPYPMPLNRGREASVYLTYIIHHYYDLPDYMVFIHGTSLKSVSFD